MAVPNGGGRKGGKGNAKRMAARKAARAKRVAQYKAGTRVSTHPI